VATGSRGNRNQTVSAFFNRLVRELVVDDVMHH
jgi:hypothetical protein